MAEAGPGTPCAIEAYTPGPSRGLRHARAAAIAAATTPEEIAAILPACTAAARNWRGATPRGSLTLDWPWPEGKVGRYSLLHATARHHAN